MTEKINKAASVSLDIKLKDKTLSTVRKALEEAIKAGVKDGKSSIQSGLFTEMTKQAGSTQAAIKALRNETKGLLKEVNSIPKNSLLQVQQKYSSSAEHIKQLSKNNLSTPLALSKFRGYQSALIDLERKAAGVYHKLNTLDSNDYKNKYRLQQQLDRLEKKYRSLNKEALSFRKKIGTPYSRGFFDLNSNLDYFQSKFRSKLAMMTSERLLDSVFNAPQKMVEGLSKLEQAKVNFAQVMPDSFSNDQNLMNQALREFIQVAADYGTSMEDVTEAARLWGRQYKDIGVVNEFVRASTKLSITDNMSLVEVNKALEATMQQYGISAKTAGEAQFYSNKMVDSWAHLADTAVVTAADLAKANEQSASAAHQNGISFDYLQGMIATMSAKTGKSGAEVGRSIRSMLVSMNTSKARKEFAKLGIALEEVDANGVKHVRNMEKVIDELMDKLANSKTDIRNSVLAMSGGRFQFNNVLALLTAKDEFRKNYNLSRTSAGWADQQVKLQYDTISRQIKALQADAYGLLMTLDKAGASNGLRDIIVSLREIVQVLQNIDPTNINMMIQSFKAFIALQAGLKVLSLTFVQLPRQIVQLQRSFAGLPARIAASTSAIRSFSMALNLAVKVTNVLGIILAVLQVGYTIYEAYNAESEKAAKQAAENAQQNKNEAESAKQKADVLKELSEKIEKNRAILADSTKTVEERKKADEDLIVAKVQVLDILDEEGRAHITESKYAKEAMQGEIDKLINMSTAYKNDQINYYEAQVNKTETLAKELQNRIKMYEAEAELLGGMLDSMASVGDNVPEIFKNRLGTVTDEASAAVNSQYEANKSTLSALKKQANEAQQAHERAKDALIKAKKAAENVNHDDTDSKLVDESGSGGGSGSGGSGEDYAAKAERLALQKQKNELWYDGKIAAQTYENALKRLANQEELEGVSAETSIQKTALYQTRIKGLEEYKSKLLDLKTTLITMLDEKITSNPEIAKQLGYTADLTSEQKIRIMEVNKETFQEMKSFTAISKLISETNSKLTETDGKIQDVNHTLAKTKLSMKTEDVYQRKAQELKHFYDVILADNSGFNSFHEDSQKIKAEIQYLISLYKAQMERVIALRDEYNKIKQGQDEVAIQNAKTALQQAELDAKQTMANIRQAKLDSTAAIREGLADITTQLLVDGGSWKDIWKKLWADLAKEAIYRLLQVQTQTSLLGSVFQTLGIGGGIGGGVTNLAGGVRIQNLGGSIVSNVPHTLHSGGVISSFPKMHSGGDVARGKVGVVPKLRNDEVIRTLQVGEEVNSMQDRRSNEILGAVAMKAMDSKSQAPTNINIFALDSKSFGEYLDENSDVLMGIIYKNRKLNR